MSGRFVIAGSGRCGTRYLSEAFTACGLPCGHEAVFDHDTATSGTATRWLTPTVYEGHPPYTQTLVGDSSLAAVGYNLDGYTVLAAVRDPVAVVQSWLGTAFFADRCDGRCAGDHGPGAHLESPYYRFMLRTVPELGDCRDEIDRAIVWVVRSSELAASAAGGLVVRVEHIHDFAGLAALVARRAGIEWEPQPVTVDDLFRNRHRRASVADVVPAIADSPRFPMFVRHCERFRYNERPT